MSLFYQDININISWEILPLFLCDLQTRQPRFVFVFVFVFVWVRNPVNNSFSINVHNFFGKMEWNFILPIAVINTFRCAVLYCIFLIFFPFRFVMISFCFIVLFCSVRYVWGKWFFIVSSNHEQNIVIISCCHAQLSECKHFSWHACWWNILGICQIEMGKVFSISYVSVESDTNMRTQRATRIFTRQDHSWNVSVLKMKWPKTIKKTAIWNAFE